MSGKSLYDSLLGICPGHPVFNKLKSGYEYKKSNLQLLMDYFKADYNYCIDGSYVNYVELDYTTCPSTVIISLRPVWSTRDIKFRFENSDKVGMENVMYFYNDGFLSKDVVFNLSLGNDVFPLRSYLDVIRSINRWYTEAAIKYYEWVKSGSLKEEIKSVQDLIFLKNFNPPISPEFLEDFIVDYCILKEKKCKPNENINLTINEFSKYYTIFRALGDVDLSYKFSTKCSDDAINNLWSAAKEYQSLLTLLRDSIVSKYNLPENVLNGIESSFLFDLNQLNLEIIFKVLRNFLKSL